MEGIGEGTIVGGVLGCRLGSNDGNRLGTPDGDLLGGRLGPSEGMSEVTSVGMFVGKLLGCSLGSSNGARLGSTVMDPVGDVVEEASFTPIVGNEVTKGLGSDVLELNVLGAIESSSELGSKL